MKKNKNLKILIVGIFSLFLIAGCTSASVATSWPGISAEESTAFLSYGTQVYSLDGENGSVVWRFPQEPNNNQQFYSPPAIGETIVVAGTYDNVLVGLNKDNGVLNWTFDGADDKYVGSQLVANGIVYAPNADKALYALNQDGDFLWQFKTDGPNWTTPITDGKLIFLASMDHMLYALHPSYESKTLELDADGSRTLVQTSVWSVDLGAAVVADPILFEESIFIGNISGELFSVDPTNGSINWIFGDTQEIGSIWGKPVVFDGAVLFGDDEGKVYAVDMASGEALWPEPYDAGGALIASGISTPAGVLFLTEEGRVFLIDADKKLEPVSMLETPLYSTPVLVGNQILIATATKDELIRAINLDGQLIWNFTPGK